MSQEMANYRHIEDSFKLIRVKTNISDVREIVQKFMSKEQTYASLLTAVAQNEQKYDKLKAINLVKQKQVRELQIANENKLTIAAKPSEDDDLATEQYNH